MLMSKVFVLAHLDPGILPTECFPLTYDMSKSRINRPLLSVNSV